MPKSTADNQKVIKCQDLSATVVIGNNVEVHKIALHIARTKGLFYLDRYSFILSKSKSVEKSFINSVTSYIANESVKQSRIRCVISKAQICQWLHRHSLINK